MPTTSLLHRLKTIIDLIDALPLSYRDELQALSAAQTEVPKILEFIDRAIALIDEVDEKLLANPAAAAIDSDPASLDDIGAQIASDIALGEIDGIAFITRQQLAQARRQLVVAQVEADPLQLATRRDAAMRRLRRGMIALERALYLYEGRREPHRAQIELEGSLAVRRLFWEIRRFTLGNPTERNLARRLGNLRTLLDTLQTRDVFQLVRIEDRVQMRRISNRINSWIATGRERNLEDGRRLWQDVAGFVDLLSGVNNRQELMVHDLELIDVALADLGENPGAEIVTWSTLSPNFEEMLGVDPELDTMILDRNGVAASAWGAHLTILRRRVDHASSDAAVFLSPGVATD